MKSRFNYTEEIPRIPLVDDSYLQDPERTIRKRFNMLCDLSKPQKKKIDPAEFDADGQIKERRIKALMNSLETAQKYNSVDEWINLNIFSPGYSRLESSSNILYAAAIWILDRIEETDYERDDLYRILPTDKKVVYEYVPQNNIWDSAYDPDLIASVEYLIYTRNKDIAPLDKNGLGGYRVIADSVSARGKANGDTPCRQRFDKLLSMIPQNKIDLAISHFKSQYDSWCESYFTLTSYYENNCAKLRKSLNDIITRYNTAVDEFDELEAEINKIIHGFHQRSKDLQQFNDLISGKIKSPVKRSSIAKKFGLRFVDDIEKAGHELIESNVEAQSRDKRKAKNKLMSEYHAKGTKIPKLYKKYEWVSKKYAHAIKQKEDVAELLARMASLDPTGKIKYSKKAYNRAKRKIINDPFEMCFALLYLIEIDSDIPWNFGPCIRMMIEVMSFLPWVNIRQDNTRNVSLKPSHPVIPDWLKREYYGKSYDSAPLSLAHIVYQETGCMMPRDMHKFDSILDSLKNYGINESKAVGLLYCMLSLNAARNNVKALNFDKEYMRKFEGIDSNNLPKTEEQIEIQRLRKELHAAKNEAKQDEFSYEELLAKYKAEHQELADLREIVFNTDSYTQEAETNSLVSFPHEIKHNTVIFGGHESWVKGIKNKLNGNVKYVSKDSTSFDSSLIRNAEVIWVQWKAIPHRSFYHIADEARKNQKPIRYFTSSGVSKCAEQAALYDIELR